MALISRTFFILVIASLAFGQRNNNAVVGNEDGRCRCMEYWKCVTSGGKPVSYCGPLETQVCCFVPKNAKPVGIVPRPAAKRSICGQKGFDNNQEGVSDLGEWPWQAVILEKSQDLYVCGASLLDERWILTAAHCVQRYNEPGASKLKVRLGELDVSQTDETYSYEEFDVDQIIIHQNFINTTLLNDIALLRLEHSVQKRPHVDIVCMPSVDPDESQDLRSQKCVVTGWGRPTEDDNHSLKMKEVSLPIWTNNDCQRALKSQFGSTFVLPSTAICAGSEGQDACDGDGGGPLVCLINGRWEQIGIVSYGIGCGRPELPGVYTRVLAYTTWIKQIVRTHILL